jgi:regulatory protein
MDSVVLSRFQALCSKSEQCSADILRKLLKTFDGDEDKAQEVLQSLKADKFVDDARYAAAFARDKARLEGWGPLKIRFKLRSKGIAEAAIEEGLASIDSDEAEQKLYRLVLAKRKSLEGDPQIKLKLLKFALGRGYSYDQVAPAVDKALSDG